MAVLVLQSFGSVREYNRAVLAIFSFITHTTSLSSVTIRLYTDDVKFFEPFLNGLPIQYVPLSSDQIVNMRGPADFLHRIKIAVLEEAFRTTSETILYTDSDTFFTSDPMPWIVQARPDRSWMHRHEYVFATMRNAPLPGGATVRAFLRWIDTREFEWSDETTTRIPPEWSSWNAGVMLLHPTHRNILPDVYKLTDLLFAETASHASEQYAFSIALQRHTTVAACEDFIYHYWYRIEKKIVDQFLTERLHPEWAMRSLEEKAEITKEWTRLLPNEIKVHRWMLQDTSIQAFNENRMAAGYRAGFRALLKDPMNITLIRDILYHTRRYLSKKR